MAHPSTPTLSRYLQRIGYVGPVTPDLSCLVGVHRRHALAIAYENLDVLGRVPVDQDLPRIFDKIVERGRGGWCYEMNGLLGWALREIGFDVTRLVGGVMRAQRGDEAWGNHLVLRVRLNDAFWIADTGLGDAMLEPLPLRAGTHQQGSRRFRLESLGNDQWRFHNTDGAMPPTSDLINRPTHIGYRGHPDDEARLAQTCASLQSDPASMFRQNLVCQQLTEHGVYVLLGRVLTDHGKRHLIGSADELNDVLRGPFGIAAADASDLWPAVVARHKTLFGDAPVDEIQFGPPPETS